MKKMAGVALMMLMALVMVSAVTAAEVSLDGTVLCAKCTLKKADAKECQNVLVVSQDGKDVEYYIARSEAGDAIGEVCTGRKKVTITGTVEEKDGKKWITASKVVAAKS